MYINGWPVNRGTRMCCSNTSVVAENNFGEILNLRYLHGHLFYGPYVKNVLIFQKDHQKTPAPANRKKLKNGQLVVREQLVNQFSRDMGYSNLLGIERLVLVYLSI